MAWLSEWVVLAGLEGLARLAERTGLVGLAKLEGLLAGLAEWAVMVILARLAERAGLAGLAE